MNDEQKDKVLGALKAANELCRSMHSITLRGGDLTNWEAFEKQVSTQLKYQHEILYPNAPKPNNHIIVGAGKRCLCGVYEDDTLSCQQILDALTRINVRLSLCTTSDDAIRKDSKLVSDIIKTLVEDCK